MRRYFKTRESAVKHLEVRRKAAYKRIEKRGEKILQDTSMVYFDCQCKKMWTTMMMIYTDKMIEDLKHFQPFDYEAELIAAIKDTESINKDIIRKTFDYGNKKDKSLD